MSGPCGGVWPTARDAWVAVVIEPDGRARRPATVAPTGPARQALLRFAAAGGIDLVAPEALAGQVTVLAQAMQVRLWLVPDPLAHALRKVAGLDTGPPRATAAMLARLPRVPLLRPMLRCPAPPVPNPRQLSLLAP